jgi:hypothetical protein
MLLEAVQYLKDRGEDARTLSLYGQEKNFATWGIAEINLFLHNVDDAFIAKGDTILSPKRYDPVRRQNIRHNSRRRLAECGPRQGVDVRRRTCGAASADVRWSVA